LDKAKTRSKLLRRQKLHFFEKFRLSGAQAAILNKITVLRGGSLLAAFGLE